MVFGKFEYMLGDMRMRKRTGTKDLFSQTSTQTSTQTSAQTSAQTSTPDCPCCSTSQVGLHNAKAMVFCCMDFRLRDNMVCQLNLKGYKDNYDEVIAAGCSLGYNGLLDYTGWNIFVDEHIELAYNLHNISEIIIIDHEKCGAFTAEYGELSTSDEYAKHVENLETCANTLWDKFNPINGTIKPIPNLVIIAYIISIDGGTLTEVYRKSI